MVDIDNCKDEDVRPFKIDFQGKQYDVSYVKVGYPHYVVFCDKVDDMDLGGLYKYFKENEAFSQDTLVECVRVVNALTVKARVWDRVNGEVYACGTAAAACAVASVVRGKCRRDEVITIKLKGGDLFAKYATDGNVELDGPVKLAFDGTIEI